MVPPPHRRHGMQESELLHEIWSHVGKDWRDALGQSGIAAFEHLSVFLHAEAEAGRQTFPAVEDIFLALRLTPLRAVKLLILGQDPYFNPGEAHGLSFSVRRGVPLPPSLSSVFNALGRDIEFVRPDHGCLDAWAGRGVLLLNTVLTVENGKAGSHAGKGWEEVTDAIIKAVNSKTERVVFLLWGKKAKRRRKLVTGTHHRVLTSSHPASRGKSKREFLDCGHFSKANELLGASGRGMVDWSLATEPSSDENEGLCQVPK